MAFLIRVAAERGHKMRRHGFYDDLAPFWNVVLRPRGFAGR